MLGISLWLQQNDINHKRKLMLVYVRLAPSWDKDIVNLVMSLILGRNLK